MFTQTETTRTARSTRQGKRVGERRPRYRQRTLARSIPFPWKSIRSQKTTTQLHFESLSHHSKHPVRHAALPSQHPHTRICNAFPALTAPSRGLPAVDNYFQFMILCFNSFAPPRPLIGIALTGRQFKSTMNRPCTDLFILRYCFIACHQSIIKCAWFCAYFQSVEYVYGGMVREYNIIIILCCFTTSWVSSYRVTD